VLAAFRAHAGRASAQLAAAARALRRQRGTRCALFEHRAAAETFLWHLAHEMPAAARAQLASGRDAERALEDALPLGPAIAAACSAQLQKLLATDASEPGAATFLLRAAARALCAAAQAARARGDATDERLAALPGGGPRAWAGRALSEAPAAGQAKALLERARADGAILRFVAHVPERALREGGEAALTRALEESDDRAAEFLREAAAEGATALAPLGAHAASGASRLALVEPAERAGAELRLSLTLAPEMTAAESADAPLDALAAAARFASALARMRAGFKYDAMVLVVEHAARAGDAVDRRATEFRFLRFRDGKTIFCDKKRNAFVKRVLTLLRRLAGESHVLRVSVRPAEGAVWHPGRIASGGEPDKKKVKS
jgi:hypothetical protein